VPAFGLPFPQETDTPTLRDSLRTLLGPWPQAKFVFGPGELEIQKSALIAYRAKIVALMNILEGKVSVPASDRIVRAPEHRQCGLRKPIAAARSAKAPKRTAA
jgi:hypothetical protein